MRTIHKYVIPAEVGQYEVKIPVWVAITRDIKEIVYDKHRLKIYAEVYSDAPLTEVIFTICKTGQDTSGFGDYLKTIVIKEGVLSHPEVLHIFVK